MLTLASALALSLSAVTAEIPPETPLFKVRTGAVLKANGAPIIFAAGHRDSFFDSDHFDCEAHLIEPLNLKDELRIRVAQVVGRNFQARVHSLVFQEPTSKAYFYLWCSPPGKPDLANEVTVAQFLSALAYGTDGTPSFSFEDSEGNGGTP